MPLYEYRPKSGVCDLCKGCFIDLQKMSDEPHKNCPDCGQECARVISAPIVSVRGAEYRASANAEKRRDSMARANGENSKMRSATIEKLGQLPGHTHDCALAGCHGDKKERGTGSMPRLVGVDKK